VRSAQGPSTTCGKQPALLESIAGLHLVGLVPTHIPNAHWLQDACRLVVYFGGAPVRRLPLGV